ncbi:MAG TPA: MarP family serine protease [Mycobacteriales bacterium]|nr:MarP family serine protease [Mycobacteriales bacterium]
MDLLDWLLLAICLLFGASGYRQGFVVGALAFIGFLGGGALGANFAPDLHRTWPLGLSAPLYGFLVVFLFAIVGQVLGTVAGAAIRNRMRWRPVRAADSFGGGAVSVLAVLLIAWLIGSALAGSAAHGVSREIRHSTILRAVDGAVPQTARTWFAPFRRLLDQNGFTEVFGGIGPENSPPVKRANPALAHSAVVRAARPDIVKVTGIASSCSRQLEGSGFVYAAHRVLTNAHVVAGVRSPQVSTPGGRTFPARVVVYDPNRDVAVLFVPALDVAPLSFAGPLHRGDDAIVVGYPENGPFTPVAARVRSMQNARGPTIYQNAQVTRQIYSLRAKVRPGNSGGPLLAAGGDVAGVVFAAALDNPDTGYALTAAEVAGDAQQGRQASVAVSTQGCD